MNEPECRVSVDELEHDHKQAEREKALAELKAIKRANILESGGLSIMDTLLENMTPMQCRALFEAYAQGDTVKVGVIVASLIEWEVASAAEYEAELEL